MNIAIFWFTFFLTTVGFAQKTTRIIYINNLKMPNSTMDKIPFGAGRAVRAQYESLKYESAVSFDFNKIYFVSQNQQQGVVQKGKFKQENTAHETTLTDLSTSYKTTYEKYMINVKYSSTTKLKNGKISTTMLISPIWKLTNKSKKILGYTCFEAKCKYNKESIIAYYTTEIKGQVIPLQMSFRAGVVLEYSSETRYGIATSVLLNQPNIVDFFKN